MILFGGEGQKNSHVKLSANQDTSRPSFDTRHLRLWPILPGIGLAEGHVPEVLLSLEKQSETIRNNPDTSRRS